MPKFYFVLSLLAGIAFAADKPLAHLYGAFASVFVLPDESFALIV